MSSKEATEAIMPASEQVLSVPTRAAGKLPPTSKIVSEYDQEIPQSQTADNPVAP